MSGLRVLNPGLLSTVQDGGRVGHQHLGVSPGGALDAVALCAANALVGNAPEEAALEILYCGPTLCVEADSVRLALAGARAQIEVAGDAHGPACHIEGGRSFTLRRGQTLCIGPLTHGVSAYLAVEGGLAIEPVLGSRATDIRSGIGGLNGRALARGDLIPLRRSAAVEQEEWQLAAACFDPPRRIRVLPGPQRDHFDDAAFATLLAGTYRVGANSSRMALRLCGPRIADRKGGNIVSDATMPGAIQIPGDGQPIVLLADRQTTGGYPKIATVISADIPALGRLAAGSAIGFQAVSLDEALAARADMMAALTALPERVVPLCTAAADVAPRLHECNLISGVFDAAA